MTAAHDLPPAWGTDQPLPLLGGPAWRAAQPSRLRVRPARVWAPTWWYCDEHAALVDAAGICPGPSFDLALAARSVTVQATYAFGDWPSAAAPA